MEGNKVSGAEIMAEFIKLNQRMEVLERCVTKRYDPEPFLVYKPNVRDTSKGSALRLNFRAAKGGGLFLDLAVQKPEVDENGNPRFYWDKKELVEGMEPVTAKLGMPDLNALLLGYRFKRTFLLPTPESVRSAVKDASGKWGPETEGNTVGLTHKLGKDITIIEWKFMDKGSFLTITKLPDRKKRFISLSLAEELALVLYLSKAQDAFLDVGLR